jgi:hypothetical protein
MTHFELFFLFEAGFKPMDIINVFGYHRSTAYRAYGNFRKGRKRATQLIKSTFSISLKMIKKTKCPRVRTDEK